MKSQNSTGTTSNHAKNEKTERKKKKAKKSSSNFSKEYANTANNTLLDETNKKLIDEEDATKAEIELKETPSKPAKVNKEKADGELMMK